MLIDTHSHIYVGKFDADRDEMIERARTAGVGTIIVPATRPNEFEQALALTERYPEVRVAIGIHPHHAAEIGAQDLEAVERLAHDERTVAVGEIGLDYFYNFAPPERQQDVFRHQLGIAKRLDLPAVIHNRESDKDVLSIIEQEQDGRLKFQLHCFSSGLDILERALALGAMISFTGNITYSTSVLDNVVRAVPDDRIMIETDAPYLTPVPHRGKRNEPGYVGLVAAKAAELRGTSLEAITLMTTQNAQRFFKLAMILIALLPFAVPQAHAQADSTPRPLSVVLAPTLSAMPPDTVRKNREPVRAIDTTPRPMFNKWVGIGGHLAFSTYISGSVTEVDGILGQGGWLSITPLQALDIDWIQLDFIYTYVVNTKAIDTNFHADNFPFPPVTPPNKHTTIDISIRAIANARNLVSFYGSLGATYFHNEFGADQWFIENLSAGNVLKDYRENAWGIGGAFGISLNFKTNYGLIAPTAEWRVATISTTRELPKHSSNFVVSQPRIGVLIYPDFNKLF